MNSLIIKILSMKSRIAWKIIRNCGYDKEGYKSQVYSRQQVREALRVFIRLFDKRDRIAVICDCLSGGVGDTYRWRGCETEGWNEPWFDFDTAQRIGQYLVNSDDSFV